MRDLVQMIRGRHLLVLALLASTACTSIGPRTLEHDSFAYSDVLGTTWKRSMLLNMVKLRYADAPVFVQVASLINQYSLEGQVSISSPGWDRPNNVGPPMAGIAGRWADRPTITYAPVSGEQFTKNLLTPIQPVSLLAMVQSGWPVEFVFGVAVRSMNGLANGTRSGLLRQDPDPRFGELLETLGRIQRSSAIDLRIDRQTDGDVAILVLHQGDLAELTEDRHTVRRLLGIDEEVAEFRLQYGSIAEQPNEIAILTRSVLEIIGEFGFGIEAPLQHVLDGRVLPSPEFEGRWQPPTVHIRAGDEEPDDAFVTVRYRDNWFWIDDRDFASKRRFSFLLLLTSLAESGTSPSAPLVTVSTGG